MSAVLLEVERLSKSFGGVAALDQASFAVEEGSITALIGPNGAGKTTAFNVISGFLTPDAGTIRFAGRSIERLRGDLVARAGLVRAFQTPRVLTRMSVLDNMLLAGKDQPGERLSLNWLTPRRVAVREFEVHRRALDLLELLRLLPLAEAYAGTLSGGQRKLLEFARALMAEPRLVLLDEPMAGVNRALGANLLDEVERCGETEA
jgi:ABC-type branched-subunit amino acid transport system ATPase component